IQIQQTVLDEAWWCAAFEAIEQHCHDLKLTDFEYDTLAAVWLFHQHVVDVAILEVGLGGRLDATNVWDADFALITNIGLDHTEWLGDTRESIAYEKSGIMRRGQTVICGDVNPPKAIAEQATQCGAILYQYGKDYHHDLNTVPESDPLDDQLDTKKRETWSTYLPQTRYHALPKPALHGKMQYHNAANAIMLLHCATEQHRLTINPQHITQGLQTVSLKGRLQWVQQQPDVYMDVAHNTDAVEELANFLKNQKKTGKTRAIFSILADKDVQSVVACITPQIDEWHVAPLNHSRAMPIEKITTTLQNQAALPPCYCYNNLQEALKIVLDVSEPHDKVVIFGSFLVVSSLTSHF
ncbi:MAG TPA: bifunctional folylpolyglutamate synthase/dihydrofolate synthase, partial [Thiothrix sp.]|nr:bifunctional folylpolyglutamate synthase/dihydrofolate synthase [Thiothrix sp.]